MTLLAGSARQPATGRVVAVLRPGWTGDFGGWRLGDEVTIRRGVPTDGEAIAQVYLGARRAAMPYLPRLYTDAQTRRWLTETVLPEQTVLVALVEGQAVGFLALAGDRVEHLYIRPDRQRSGAGRRLLAEAKALAPGGLELVTFQKNDAARAFYESEGFVAAAFGDGSGNEENEPDMVYRWTGPA